VPTGSPGETALNAFGGRRYIENVRQFCKDKGPWQRTANIGLRSQYPIRLYAWAKKYVSNGKKRVSLEDLRKVFGLESVKDAEESVIQVPPLPVWANFRQRSLDVAITEINRKTDLKIGLQSLESQQHRGQQMQPTDQYQRKRHRGTSACSRRGLHLGRSRHLE
jgi:hypothetical protein